MRNLFFTAIAALAFAAPALADQEGSADPYLVFAPHSLQTRYQIDHQPWTNFLTKAVYVVGRSNREPARRSSNKYRMAGTRLTTTSNSRYRFEGNRVLFHLFDDDVIEYVGLYRQALQDTMNRVDYGDFSRDEQLAFWVNLYNAVVIHEIAKAHPISKPSRIRIDEQNTNLYNAKLVTVHGVDLSLNDIRYNILYRYWRNPNVMYGLWEGTIGGPNIMSIAYLGSTVNVQLESNAREYINSLRGVDRIRGEMRISKLYLEARPYYYAEWPSALYTHLLKYADGETAAIVSEGPKNPRASRYDSNTADAESGETISYSGSDNAAAVAAGADLGRTWENLSSTGLRGGLSGEAEELTERVEVRRGRRVGTVTILDVHTDDPDAGPAPILQEVGPAQDEDADEENEAANEGE